MAKKHVYKKDDRVRIINPEIVMRVGYPLTASMVQDQMTHADRDKIEEMLNHFGLNQKKQHGDTIVFRTSIYDRRYEVFKDKIEHAIAFALVGLRNFGGGERSLHLKKISEILNLETTVLAKKVVKTGDYYPSTSSQDYYGDWDYEPGGLDNAKTHVLLEVYNTTCMTLHADDGSSLTPSSFWIEEKNVEFVSRPGYTP